MRKPKFSHHAGRVAAVVLGLAALGPAIPAALAQTSSGSISSQQVVQRMIEHNRERAAELKGYHAERHYTVTYHGFPTSLSASMAVDATYEAPTTKRFHVISTSGSKLLINKVLMRLLDSEQDAARDPEKTALTPANYTFTLLGQQAVGGRQCYALRVEPRKNSKFLYRGKVYVDAEDYAVTQIDAEPAKNPSFWIKQVHIHHVYGKVGKFWLPRSDRSETTLRFGGTAVLTIDYGTYQVQAANGQ